MIRILDACVCFRILDRIRNNLVPSLLTHTMVAFVEAMNMRQNVLHLIRTLLEQHLVRLAADISIDLKMSIFNSIDWQLSKICN